MKSETSKKGLLAKLKLWLIGLAVVFVLITASGLYAYKNYADKLKPVGTSQESQLFTVESGQGAQAIGLNLEEAKLIRSAWAFEWYARLNGLRDNLQAGTYALNPSQSVQEIADILTKGKVDTKLVTIYPSKRLEEVRDSLVNQGFDAEQVDAALDPTLYARHPALANKPADASLEGYLYPETFQRTAETDVRTIITLSLDEFAKRLTPEIKAGIQKQGLSVHQAVILASIVGREISNPDDQKIVAQVFLKRFRSGMELGADATTRYAVDKPKGPLTAEDLANSSPYNTRKSKGLPPGPISNFKQSALEAVANPASTDYLFFVTGRDFVTRYSNTFAEHQALIKQHGVAGEE